MSDAVWVLGASMTRFGRYPDLDTVDLASQACIDALADGGVTIHDMDILAAGTLFQQSGICLLYTSPSPRDGLLSRMPSSA